MLCKFKSCEKCSGGLVLDYDEWHCFQCGHIYYPQRSPMEMLLDPMEVRHPLSTDISPGEEGLDRKRRKAHRSPRRINSAIAATSRSDENWWGSNRQVIHHIDQGKTVQEIAEIVGVGAHQVRVIRERLYDLRSSSLEPMAPTRKN